MRPRAAVAVPLCRRPAPDQRGDLTRRAPLLCRRAPVRLGHRHRAAACPRPPRLGPLPSRLRRRRRRGRARRRCRRSPSISPASGRPPRRRRPGAPRPTPSWSASVLGDMESPVVVLGHSFGGRVALHLAVQRPESVRALVLTGVPMLHPLGRRDARPRPGVQGDPAPAPLRLVSDEAMEAARQRYGSADYRAAQGVMRQVLVRAVNETYEAQLDAVRCPVHLVWGADDTAAPLEVAERAARPAGPRRPGRPSRCGSSDAAPHPRRVARRRRVMFDLIGTVACALALVPAGARWLRVAQREHYLAGSTTRFAWRWWALRPPAPALAVVALAGAGVAFAYPLVALATAAIVVLGPPLLGVRGRTSPLVFTPRLRRLTALWLVLQARGDRCRDTGAPRRSFRRTRRLRRAGPGRRRGRPPQPRRAPPGHPVRHGGAGAPGPGGADGGGDHRVVRQDLDQAARGPPAGRLAHGRGQPGLLQQPGRSGARRQRATPRRAPTSSWPRWAPTARVRSPSSAAGARPPLR